MFCWETLGPAIHADVSLTGTTYLNIVADHAHPFVENTPWCSFSNIIHRATKQKWVRDGLKCTTSLRWWWCFNKLTLPTIDLARMIKAFPCKQQLFSSWCHVQSHFLKTQRKYFCMFLVKTLCKRGGDQSVDVTSVRSIDCQFSNWQERLSYWLSGQSMFAVGYEVKAQKSHLKRHMDLENIWRTCPKYWNRQNRGSHQLYLMSRHYNCV